MGPKKTRSEELVDSLLACPISEQLQVQQQLAQSISAHQKKVLLEVFTALPHLQVYRPDTLSSISMKLPTPWTGWKAVGETVTLLGEQLSKCGFGYNIHCVGTSNNTPKLQIVISPVPGALVFLKEDLKKEDGDHIEAGALAELFSA